MAIIVRVLYADVAFVFRSNHVPTIVFSPLHNPSSHPFYSPFSILSPFSSRISISIIHVGYWRIESTICIFARIIAMANTF